LLSKPVYADPEDTSAVSGEIAITVSENTSETGVDPTGAVDAMGEDDPTETEAVEEYGLPENAKIPSGVFLDDLNISGLTMAEVDALVEARIRELGEKKLRLSTPKTFVQITLGELGLYWSNRSQVYREADSLVLPGSLVTQYKSQKDLEFSNMTLSLETKVDKERLTSFLLEHMEELNCEPKNAYVRRFANEFVVVDGTEGVAISADATYNEIAAAVQKANTTLADARILKVDAVGNTTKPEFYKDIFEGFGDLLGEYHTHYSTKLKERTVNVTIATTKFNGLTIYPGQEVSALEIMRPVTTEAGYRKAPTYTSSGVEDETGGGICQVATTLYNAVLQAELEVTYRKNHSRTASYVPIAQDAMVYSAGNSDFRFRNNLDHPIYIESFIDNSTNAGRTEFRIYGVEYREKNRTIEYKAELVSYSIPDEGASPYEYYKLRTDASIPSFEEAQGDPNKEFAVFLSSFYPAAVARLHKIVYIDGKEVSNTVVNTSNYTNRSAGHTAGTYISGSFRVNPDTIIKSIEYTIDDLLEGKEPRINWAKRPYVPPTTEAPETTTAESDETGAEDETDASKASSEATTKAAKEESTKAKEEATKAAAKEEPTKAKAKEEPTKAKTVPTKAAASIEDDRE